MSSGESKNRECAISGNDEKLVQFYNLKMGDVLKRIQMYELEK